MLHNIQYLGTGAAEGIPSPFCECRVCSKARKEKGLNIKTRSCTLINDDILIDISPDLFSQCIACDIQLSKIKHIFITHSHSDHLDLFSLMLRCRPGASKNREGDLSSNSIFVYGNDHVERKIEEAFKEQPYADRTWLHFIPLKITNTICIDDIKVTPLRANHKEDETCFIFLINDNNKAIFYGNDTGSLPEDTMQYLLNYDKMLKLVSLDCTRGTLNGDSHMGLQEVIQLLQELKKNRKINNKTKVLLNHYSHACGLTPAEFSSEIKCFGMDLSFDGQKIQFSGV